MPPRGQNASATDWSAAYYGRPARRTKNPDRAEELLKQGISEFSTAAQLPYRLAYLLIGEGSLPEALHWAEKALELATG